jgi:hypothetical protein
MYVFTTPAPAFVRSPPHRRAASAGLLAARCTTICSGVPSEIRD